MLLKLRMLLPVVHVEFVSHDGNVVDVLRLDLDAENIETPRRLVQKVAVFLLRMGHEFNQPLVLHRAALQTSSAGSAPVVSPPICETDADLDASIVSRGLRNNESLRVVFVPRSRPASAAGSAMEQASKRLKADLYSRGAVRFGA